MNGFRDRLSKQMKRAGTVANNARITAEIVVAATNDVAVPVAQQVDLVGPVPATEISREIEMDREKQWAEYEKLGMERASEDTRSHADVPIASQRDKARDPARKAKRTRER